MSIYSASEVEPPRKVLKQSNTNSTSTERTSLGTTAQRSSLAGSYRCETGNLLLCRIQNTRTNLTPCLPPFRHQALSESVPRFFDSAHYFGTGDVLEISGPPASGKSSLLLGIIASSLIPKCQKSGSLDITLNGPELPVIFLDCDAKFSIMKLMAMAEWLLLTAVSSNPAYSSLDYTSVVAAVLERCMESFQYTVTCSSTELHRMLRRIEDSVTKHGANVKTVVIDSISAFYFVDKCENSDIAPNNTSTAGIRFTRIISNRQDDIIRTIHRLSKELGITVIFTNSVLFSDRAFSSLSSKLTGLPLTPWNSVVTHKIVFNKPYKQFPPDNYENIARSWAFEAGVKLKEMSSFKYCIDSSGFIQLILPRPDGQ